MGETIFTILEYSSRKVINFTDSDEGRRMKQNDDDNNNNNKSTFYAG